MRIDKTLSELWHLRGNTDEDMTYQEYMKMASDTAFMAIGTLKRQEELLNKQYEFIEIVKSFSQLSDPTMMGTDEIENFRELQERARRIVIY